MKAPCYYIEANRTINGKEEIKYFDASFIEDDIDHKLNFLKSNMSGLNFNKKTILITP